MGTNRKTTPRRGTTLGDSDADRWLRGESCGFFEFKPDDELAPLWLAHGDDEKFFWRRGIDSMPISLETLTRYENAWLGTGKGSEYGGSAFFVFKNYTDQSSGSYGTLAATRIRFGGSRKCIGQKRFDFRLNQPSCPQLISNRLTRCPVKRCMRTGQSHCTWLPLAAGAFCIDATKRHDERADQRDY